MPMNARLVARYGFARLRPRDAVPLRQDVNEPY